MRLVSSRPNRLQFVKKCTHIPTQTKEKISDSLRFFVGRGIDFMLKISIIVQLYCKEDRKIAKNATLTFREFPDNDPHAGTMAVAQRPKYS